MQINNTSNINFGWVRTPFMCFTKYNYNKKALEEVAEKYNCNITVMPGKEVEVTQAEYVGEICDFDDPVDACSTRTTKGVFVTLSEKPDDIWQMLFGEKKELTHFIPEYKLEGRTRFEEYVKDFYKISNEFIGLKELNESNKLNAHPKPHKKKNTNINIDDKLINEIEGFGWKLALLVGCGIFGYSYRKNLANFLGKERILRMLRIKKCEKIPPEYAISKFRF